MKILQELTNLMGPAGFESEISEYLLEKFSKSKNVKECWKDKIGNVYGIIPGKTTKKLLVAAHMDEVGLMISHVSEKGFMRFLNIGGITKQVLPNCKVVVKGVMSKKKIKGIIGVNPPHAKSADKPLDINELFIDTGYSKKELEELGIGIGSIAVFDTTFEQNNNILIGKAFDDRLGVAALVHIAQDLKEQPDPTIVLVGTVQEEVGLRGGEVVSKMTNPDYALIIEGTFAMDTPGNRPEDWTTYFGEGPALTIMDGSMIVDRRYLDYLETIFKKEKIKYQYKQPRNAGGTDAGKIHLRGEGVPTAVIAAPCRYIHSSYSLVHKNDYNSIKKIAVKFCEHISVEKLEKIYK